MDIKAFESWYKFVSEAKWSAGLTAAEVAELALILMEADGSEEAEA